MLGEYNSSGCGYPNPEDSPEEYPCLECGEDTGEWEEDFCSEECEYIHNECEKDIKLKFKKEEEL